MTLQKSVNGLTIATGEDDDLGDTSHYEKPLVVVEVKPSPAIPAPAPVLSKSLALELSK